MDRKKIDNAAQGKRPSDIEKQLKRRVIVYLFAIAIVYGAWRVMRPTPTPVGLTATESIDALDTPIEPMPPAARIDSALLATVRDETNAERAYLERDAQVHLLEQSAKLAYGDLDQLGLQGADWEQLAADPAGHRGEPYWVLGQLKWMDSEEVDRLIYYRGLIEDEDGKPWSFMVLTQPWEVEVGDIVKVSGFFLKMYDMVQPDTRFVRAPVIVGEELLISAYRIPPVTQLRPDLFDTVLDHDLTQANRPLDSLAFYELLSYAKHTPGEESVETQPHMLLQEPEFWRGQPVHMTGVLMYMNKEPLGPRGENPLGSPFVWQLWVSDTRSGDAGTMLVLSLDKPEGVSEGDIIDVEGTFFRRFSFENKANRPRMVAVIPAHSITKFTPGEDELTPVLMKIIVSVVGAIMVLVIIGQWREKRDALLARTERMARKRRLVATGGGPGAPAVATEITSARTRRRRDASGSDSASDTPPADGPTT
jgi:hypothetical protein